MTYNEYIPWAPLSRFVKCIWTLEINTTPGANQCEKILPDGCTELIFNYGDRYHQYDAAHNHWLQPQSFLHGQMKGYIEIAPTGNTGIIAARFFPHGLSAFTDTPAYSLTDRVVDTPALFGPAARTLEERIGNTSSETERVRLLNGFLLERLRQADTMTHVISQAIDSITTAGGNLRINQLAAAAYMSERQFERVFLSRVGVTPKAFSKIIRFQYSIRAAQQGLHTSLTSLALDNGYYDQAHFIRNFREFAGVTPAQFFADKHDMSDLFTGS